MKKLKKTPIIPEELELEDIMRCKHIAENFSTNFLVVCPAHYDGSISISTQDSPNAHYAKKRGHICRPLTAKEIFTIQITRDFLDE